MTVQLYVITQNYEGSRKCRLGEALFFPKVTCLTDTAKDLRNLVTGNGLALLPHVPNLELATRPVAIHPELIQVEVSLTRSLEAVLLCHHQETAERMIE